MIAITLPDGTVKQVSEGTSSLDVATSISEGLARNVLAAEVNGEVWDPTRPFTEDSTLKLLTSRDDEGMSTLWHSSAHLMAEAIESLYPGVKFWVGLRWKMASTTTWISGAHVHRFRHSCGRAKNDGIGQGQEPICSQRNVQGGCGQVLRSERRRVQAGLLEGLEDGTITFYTQGNFTDLCRGPHIPHYRHVKAAKIMAIAGAYWKGDETQKQLTRVYGVTFTKKSDLKEHLERLEQAKARDHRKLGKELDLFHFSEKVGQGCHFAAQRRRPPHALGELPKKPNASRATSRSSRRTLATKSSTTSGHYAKYGEDSFQPINTPAEGEEYSKPMNCPHHCEIFKARPVRTETFRCVWWNSAPVYRYEQSGELLWLDPFGVSRKTTRIFSAPNTR